MIKNKGILNLDFSKTVIVKHKRSMVNVFELFYEFDGVCNYNGDDEQGTGATGSILLTESEIETKRCLNYIINYFFQYEHELVFFKEYPLSNIKGPS